MTNEKQHPALSNNYFVVQKLVFKIVGLSLSSKNGAIYEAYGIFILIVLLTYLILALLESFGKQENFDVMANNLIFVPGFILATAKHVIMYFKRTKLGKVLDALETDPFLSDSKYRQGVQIKWIDNCVDVTKRLTIIFASMGILCIMACLIVSYIIQKKGENVLPFGTLLVLCEHMNFEIVRWYQSFCFFFVAIGFPVADIIYASIVLHVCVHCKILQEFIKNMVKISFDSMTEDKFEQVSSNRTNWLPHNSYLPWKSLQRFLKETVLLHMTIMEVSEQIEAIYNIPVLAEFTLLSVTFCCLMYQLSLVTALDFTMIKYMLLLMGSLLPLFLLSYCGDELILESQAIAGACYELYSVGSDIRLQKGLMLIMQRSQKPLVLTVGKFFGLSLTTMVMFCRAYLSYYMVIREMNAG